MPGCATSGSPIRGEMMAELTVLIATHNGAEVLARTLQGYTDLGDPGFEWKLVLVDSASTDNTLDIINGFKSKLPLKVLQEPSPGKNRALNRGLSETEGDLLVLSDDDSIPHPGFLQAWRSAAARLSEADIMGGSIVPLFDTEPPHWMLQTRPHFAELYAERQGVPEGPIGADWIFGPNMAVRAGLIHNGLRFDEGIGPDASRKTTYAMGSETAFLYAAARAGHKLAFASGPAVSHIVRTGQIEAGYIAGRAYRMGRGTAVKQVLSGEIILRKRIALVSFVGGVVRGVSDVWLSLQSLVGPTQSRFEARWDVAFRRGYRDEVRSRKASIE